MALRANRRATLILGSRGTHPALTGDAVGAGRSLPRHGDPDCCRLASYAGDNNDHPGCDTADETRTVTRPFNSCDAAVSRLPCCGYAGPAAGVIRVVGQTPRGRNQCGFSDGNGSIAVGDEQAPVTRITRSGAATGAGGQGDCDGKPPNPAKSQSCLLRASQTDARLVTGQRHTADSPETRPFADSPLPDHRMRLLLKGFGQESSSMRTNRASGDAA